MKAASRTALVAAGLVMTAQAAAQAVHDNPRRNGERVFEANVTSVRAILGPPEQRCWVERAQVSHDGGIRVPGTMVGALIGGVLGHQVGGGRGKDVARDGGIYTHGQDVQRCADVQSQGRPDHWDVAYVFRGREHRVQTTFAPGPTITVNGQGEPRA